jgi:uncharacterized protein YkwD
VAIGRHAYNVIRRRLPQALAGVALLALCVACCAVASGASAAASERAPRASASSSRASAPARHSSRRHAVCARRASFHSSGGPHGKSRRSTHRSSCAKRKRPRHLRSSKSKSHQHTSPARGACANAELQPNGRNLALIDAATLCLVNRERTSRGEAALRPNADLARAAQAHSTDMADDDYFAHDSRNGATPLSRMRASGYIYSAHIGYAVGENIAWATLSLATPSAIVAGWMASPGHRANILDATFRDTGVGVAPRPLASSARGESGAIYTQDFGRIIRP